MEMKSGKTNFQLNRNFVQKYGLPFLVIGLSMVSFGILTVTIGGSWDITNHLLNKPEEIF